MTYTNCCPCRLVGNGGAGLFHLHCLSVPYAYFYGIYSPPPASQPQPLFNNKPIRLRLNVLFVKFVQSFKYLLNSQKTAVFP